MGWTLFTFHENKVSTDYVILLKQRLHEAKQKSMHAEMIASERASDRHELP